MSCLIHASVMILVGSSSSGVAVMDSANLEPLPHNSCTAYEYFWRGRNGVCYTEAETAEYYKSHPQPANSDNGYGPAETYAVGKYILNLPGL